MRMTMETAFSEPDLKMSEYTCKDGEFGYSITTVDGIGMFQFPSAVGRPEIYVSTIRNVMNFKSRPDDIILATYPKSGTHWMWEIIYMLLQGNANYRPDVKEAMTFELMNEQKSFDQLPSPRVLNTHFPWRWLPLKHKINGGKFIHVIRNPKDVYVSYFHHLKVSGQLGIKAKDMTWKQYVDNYIFGNVQLYGTWFSYEKEMAAAKTENENILTVHFERLKKAPQIEIGRLARFLSVNVTDDLIDEIAKKCKFENLRKANEELKTPPKELLESLRKAKKILTGVRASNVYRKEIQNTLRCEDSKFWVPDMSLNIKQEHEYTSLVNREGKDSRDVGDWKNHFTVAQNDKFDKLYANEMADLNLEVLFEMNKDDS